MTNDWDTAKLSGFYYGKTNSPDGGWWAGAVYAEGSGYAFQHLYKNGTNLQKVRECNNNTWGDWIDVGPNTFAPSGFGLGRAQSASDKNIDDVTAPGWYHMTKNQTIGDITVDYCYLLVTAWADGSTHCTQVAYLPSSGHQYTRRKQNGTWGSWERCDPSVFAPNGYGLGAISPAAVTDANARVNAGWYRTTSSTTSFSGVHGAGIVLPYGEGRVIHIHGRTTNGAMRIRYTPNSDGVFVDELINPAREPGVEYRTIERWSSKVVYTKVINMGSLANNSTTTISANTKASAVIEVSGYIKNTSESTYTTIITASNGALAAYAWATIASDASVSVSIRTLMDMPNREAFVVIKYTKD